MKNSYAIFILTGVMAVMLPSCVSSDPAYKQLEAQVDTNSSPNAILGMWSHSGSSAGEKYSSSYLFENGGGGKWYGGWKEGGDEVMGGMQWSYLGNGLWHAIGDNHGKRFDLEFKIVKGKKVLLMVMKHGGSQHVLNKVHP